MNYEELLKNICPNKPNYNELLECDEWKNLRERLLQSQPYCQHCKKGESLNNPPHFIKDYQYLYEDFNVNPIVKTKDPSDIDSVVHEIDISDLNPAFNFRTSLIPIILQIHHQYYRLQTLPWDYQRDCFMILCRECHYKVHEENFIPVFDKFHNNLSYQVCGRCKGYGYLPEFWHVENGICFECRGNRFVERLF